MRTLARRLLALTLCLGFSIALAWAAPPNAAVLTPEKPAKAAAGTVSKGQVPKAQRVYSMGHSFHFFVPGILEELAELKGITGHEQVGVSAIGGSSIIQHWNVPDDKFKSKATLEAGDLDVLTMSPAFLPDEGIENFVRLAAEKCPQIRILIQESWLPFDTYVDFRKEKVSPPDREVVDFTKLEAEYERSLHDLAEVVKRLNEKYGGKPALFVTPVGQAVLTLRKRIAAEKAPGLTKQSDLFADAIGHSKAPLAVLAGYCYYAQIYGNPIGLPVPPALKEVGDRETTARLNLLLQEIAWDTVTHQPLSGVTVK